MTLQGPRPGLYRPAYHYGLVDAMVKELLVERTPESQGLFVANTVQGVWELGRRYGLPDVRQESVDIDGQDVFIEGPLIGHRWHVVAITKPVTSGNSSIVLRPKSSTDTLFRATPSGTAAININLPWPGWPIEHQAPFDGGAIGLTDSANAGDTARTFGFLFYDVEC